MDWLEKMGCRASETLIFEGRQPKSLCMDKNLNSHCYWNKNITLKCFNYCQKYWVHIKA